VPIECARLERIGFVDAIAFSRGGLVLRSLVEHVLPSSPLKARLDQPGLGCLCHGAYVPQMMSSERLSKCRRRLPKAERDAGKRSDGPTGAEPEELTRRRRR
jgi:hypothetical protein